MVYPGYCHQVQLLLVMNIHVREPFEHNNLGTCNIVGIVWHRLDILVAHYCKLLLMLAMHFQHHQQVLLSHHLWSQLKRTIGTQTLGCLGSITSKTSAQRLQRVRVLQWMEATDSGHGHSIYIISKVVWHFPDIFRSPSHITNLVKCGRWWKKRAFIFQSIETDKLFINHIIVRAKKE